MEQLLLMDAGNYDPAMPEFRRVAVRGIIFVQGKLLLIRSADGEVKLPGGGQEKGETDLDTLVREVAEETGYHVAMDSIRPFGEVVERRLSLHEPMIWRQINRYYFCDVEGEQGACYYTTNEKRFGFCQVWYTLDEAIEANREMLRREGVHTWEQRELKVLELLKGRIAEG